MEPPPDQLLTALRYHVARLAEIKEQIADGIDLLAELPDTDTVLPLFVQIYGTLAFMHQDLVALLPAQTGATT